MTGSHPGKASLPLAALEFPCLVLFGNEGRGLEPRLLERFPLVRLEQEERIDSLNVAVSACILMHELRRLHGLVKKLLLHVCCGPCSPYVLQKLRADFAVSGFFYNPNIQPFREYEFRRLEVARLAEKLAGR